MQEAYPKKRMMSIMLIAQTGLWVFSSITNGFHEEQLFTKWKHSSMVLDFKFDVRFGHGRCSFCEKIGENHLPKSCMSTSVTKVHKRNSSRNERMAGEKKKHTSSSYFNGDNDEEQNSNEQFEILC